VNTTTFPTESSYNNLHYSDVEAETKFLDVWTDLYMLVVSEALLTASQGGFIGLVQRLRIRAREPDSHVARMFSLETTKE